MPVKAVIITPFPTVEETAREMGVGEKRVRQLTRLVAAIVEGRSGTKKAPATKRATTKRKRTSHR